MGIRFSTALLAAVGMCSAGAEAARSRLGCIELAGGVKQISPEGIAETGPGQLPEAIVAIRTARIRIVDSVTGAAQLRVTKSTLTPQQAYGAGLPNGYTGGGPRNPSGPWVGLMWPFRDFNDGYVPTTSGPPLGNDVGDISPVASTSNEITVTGISASMAYSLSDPSTFQRGLPGNGGADFISFFSIDIAPTTPTIRNVTVFLEGVEYLTVISDENGRLVTQVQQAADVSLSFQVPAPGTAPVLGGMAILAMRRRRRS